MSVADRVASLTRFVEAAHGHLPEEQLAPARALIARVGERLALSREHTVVALAGSTGTGKSSIFNGLAGVNLSQTGVRRPTTGQAHACVFGQSGADGLLDWLDVGRRFHRDATASGLDGLVLLDLPDFDSVDVSHRVEADRLLAVVDLIVWVLHPQKYADKVVHRGYLDRFHRHRDITVVVLNQVDLLSDEDLRTCLDDLRRLLDDDGLAGVPIVTASTIAEPGLGELVGVLAKAVAARQAALRRLSADLDEIVANIDLGAPVYTPDKVARERLVDALARAAGVPVVANATRKAYIHRARKVTGWPPLRWLRRFRPDPLERLHLEANAAATSIGPASPAALAGVSIAVRELATGQGPWAESMVVAARSRMDDLPDALDQAVARTDLGLRGTRMWWKFFGFLQWIAVGIAVAGLLWLAVRYVMFALALPEPPMPHLGRLPLPTALVAGGLLAGLLLSFLARPLVRIGAARRRRKVEKALRANVSRVADDLILAPTNEVVASYERAAEALAASA